MKTFSDSSPVPAVSVAEVASRLRTGGVRVYDCNPPQEWTRGHIPGATNLDPACFRSAELPAAADAMVVFYGTDESCSAAAFAAQRARSLGYTNVHLMSAGLAGWEDEGWPVEHVRPKRVAVRS
ncbi:MAG: rhodanese-like domain-containing protein [Opitutae bacterium]|nr:rhodanese-like domain-containing protein [Opitutae bacterium]